MKEKIIGGEVYGKHEVAKEVIEILGDEANEVKKEIAMIVTDLVYETRFEKFETTKVTSVRNETVQNKAELLFRIPELQDKIIPESLKSEYPVEYDDETLKKAPWVNMVHAWNKVLNELNTVSAMQKEETPISPLVLASITHVLYKFTTNSDTDPFIRGDEQFLKGEKYVETIKRESGTEGANARRHVCFEEMKYIFGIIKQQYPWGE